ncbi:mitogen-activated protein kinase [Musa troglodytarum]|nr:mitogen-activated protein kinase [Musa troglodytarum]
MDPRLQPQPDLDRLWANEIRYLHSLWRRGPPPNRNRNPRVSSGPDPDPLHATRVAFKRESKRKERMPTETAASPRRPDEAGTSDPPLVDSWAKLASLTAPNPNPPTAWADVAPPPFVERPPVSAEEQARLAAAQLHHDGLKASQDFFSKIGESDDEEEAHEEGEEEEDDKEEKDGRQLEAFKFFMELFEKDDELTEYYKKNHDKGEFSCFACAAIGTKRVRKFGNCLGLVQHANSISKTKRRGAHRALARAVCQVLGWDTIRSAGVVLDLGDTGGQSSAGAAKTQNKDVIENEEHLPQDITQNTKANDGNVTENLPEVTGRWSSVCYDQTSIPCLQTFVVDSGRDLDRVDIPRVRVVSLAGATDFGRWLSSNVVGGAVPRLSYRVQLDTEERQRSAGPAAHACRLGTRMGARWIRGGGGLSLEHWIRVPPSSTGRWCQRVGESANGAGFASKAVPVCVRCAECGVEGQVNQRRIHHKLTEILFEISRTGKSFTSRAPRLRSRPGFPHSACKCVFRRDVGSSVNTREVSPLRTFLHFVPWDESLASESAAVARDTVKMESTRVTAPPKFGTLARTFNKILHLHRSVNISANGAGVAPEKDDYSIPKLKLSQNFSEHSSILSEGVSDFYKVEHEKQPQNLSSNEIEAMESLLANLFASISAVKAAYAQLQLSQSPYDPDSIQSSDLAIVSELKRVSELKHSYFRNDFIPHTSCESQSALAAQIEEQRNLIKTYRITMNKLKADLKLKDSEICSRQFELLDAEKNNRTLESKLHPGRSLSALDDLHPSGLNPTHFLSVLRFTFKSIQSFVKVMVKEMESAGWDLGAAAGAIQPDVLHCNKPVHWTFAFQSYVCQKMFSDFHHKSYNLAAMEDRSMWGWRQFFDEFTQLRYVEHIQKLSQHSAIANFFRVKYLALVHPKMESSFFGNLDQRAIVYSDQSFPNSAFFAAFAEMARRVWLLHCLFFSFGEPESNRSIFQVRRGSRFSEVYMESIVEDKDVATAKCRPATVGFTVVPGFRVRWTLIQSKVYLLPATSDDNQW